MGGLVWIDGVVAFIVVVSALTGFFRGFISTVTGLAGLILGVLLAKNFGKTVSLALQNFWGDDLLSAMMGYVIVFAVVFSFFLILSAMLRAIFSKMHLGGLDYLGGMVLGVVRGGIYSLLLLLALAMTPITRTLAWEQSYTTPAAGLALRAMFHFFPKTRAYQGWVRFDAYGRPAIVSGKFLMAAQDAVAAPAEADALKDEAAAQGSRNDRVRELEEELARQSAVGNDTATEMKLKELRQRHAEERRSTAGLQGVLNDLLCLILAADANPELHCAGEPATQ